MEHRLLLGMVLGAGLVGCGSVDSSWRAEPLGPSFSQPLPSSLPPGSPSPFLPAPSFGSGSGASFAGSGVISVSGHLEGELHGVVLSSNTTDNAASFELWDDGSGSLNVNIAANGNGGAGMLIASITEADLDAALSDGHWTTADAVTGTASVSSCSGPVMGQWETELPAIAYEMTAEEDPEAAGSVVVQIKARFPLDYLEPYWGQPIDPASIPTSELHGSFSFARFTEPD
jgi:hypothetical protein